MQDARKLAERIVEKMLTNGQGTKATRLVLVKDNGPPTNIIAAHQNLGGWNRKALVDLITREIESMDSHV